MPKARLIKSVIENLPFEPKTQKIYFDTELRGFGLRVGKSTKTFFVQRDINVKTYTSTIGTTDKWTPDQARMEARERLLLLMKGIDPDEKKRQQKVKVMTLRDVMEEFLIARKKLKPITKKAYRNYLNNHLADWLDKPVTDITEDKFAKRYTEIGENRGKPVANCVKRTLGTMLNYSIAAHKVLQKNPVRIIAETRSAYPDVRRYTCLKPHQLKPWYEAVNALPNRTYRDYLLLVLFTGLRRTEALSLRWTQIDFVDKSISITDTKNGDPLTLPMSDFVFKLLHERQFLTGNKNFVFPSCSGKGHFIEPKKGVEAVTAATNIVFKVHDLRRTFATVASSLDISVYAIKALLNHRVTEITGSYIVRDINRLRDPMQKIATYLQEQMGA